MKRIFAIGAVLALSACGDAMTYTGSLEDQAAAAAATASTPVDQIQIVAADTVNGGNFTVLGDVKANVGKLTAFHPNPTEDDARAKLRIEAAELGADAVINAVIGDVGVCALSWGCRVSTGTAVKFTN